jgi:hypothetical protein
MGLPVGTVDTWRVELFRSTPRPDEDPGQLRTSYARTRERMVQAVYDTAYDLLTAIRAQLATASSPEWLERQDAAGVAALLGTTTDRAIRLLAGFRAPDDDQPAIEAGADVEYADAEP